MASSDEELKKMIMEFRVAELTTLLTFAGRPKQGKKQDLQKRACELIRHKSVPIQMKIKEIYNSFRAELGHAPAPSTGNAGKQPSTFASQSQYESLPPHLLTPYEDYYSSIKSNGIMGNNLPIHPDVRLKRLPFYDYVADLLKPSTLMPEGVARLQKYQFYFHLTPAQANDLAFHGNPNNSGSDPAVQVLMRFCLLETSCKQNDFLPPGLFVKINDKTCPLPPPLPSSQPNTEPKRPPRPINITQLVKCNPTIANTIEVSWSRPELEQNYVITVEMVKKLTAFHLVQRLKSKGVTLADFTTWQIKEKLCEDADSEIATTSLRVSLLCPLGKVRIKLPCRAKSCTHLRCFDANTYLQMNERNAKWMCPVCDKPSEFDDLKIDGYFQEVLSSSKLPSDANEIELHQDGSWSISQPKKEEKLDTNKNRNGPPALSDTVEIIDDDIVPVDVSSDSEDQSTDKPVKANTTTVDLTISDDEDECPLTQKIDLPDLNIDYVPAQVSKPTLIDEDIDIIDLDCSPDPSPPPPVLERSAPLVRSPAALKTYPGPASASLPPFFDIDYPPMSPA